MDNRFEILSPAGSMEALRAGVQNGADAIYLGGTQFSARASAHNFNREELIEAVKYATLRNVDIFVTVNTSIKENEVEDLIEYTDFLYGIGVSAIILSDIGMASILRNRYPKMELHASTQISAHSLRDVLELQKIGFDRVVVARELNVEEIKEICDNVNVDIEVFVHGALCVSYSGQCLMSSMLGNRSGNRGTCAQPCRQTYKLINTTKNIEIRNMSGMYLLSPKDLCSIENMTEILDAGVKSLKIEGRMKRPEYVATVTSAYRKVLDEYVGNEKNINKKQLKSELEVSFNRGFTDGYLMKNLGSDIMNANKPNNVGTKLGEVLNFDKKNKKLRIKLFTKLSKGDGINIGGGDIGRIFKNGKLYESGNEGEIVEIDFVKDIKRGTIIYKTSDRKLKDKYSLTFKDGVEDKKISFECSIYISVGDRIRFTMDEVEVFSENIVEMASGKKLDKNMVVDKLSKTGNTPYLFNFVEINVDENAFVPVSTLNNLRRLAIEKYENKRLNFENRKTKGFSEISGSILKSSLLGRLTIKIHKNNQIDKLLEFLETSNTDERVKITDNLREIYTEDFVEIEKYRESLNKFKINLIYSAPGVLRNDEYERLERYLNRIEDKNIFSKVQISTWGQKDFFKSKFNTQKFNIDTYFNIYNSNSIKFFNSEFDAENITISQELTKFEIEKMLHKVNGINVDMIVYGYPRSMITEYCAMGVVTRDCHKDRRTAECARCDYVLRDKQNRNFRLFQDIFCRTEIRNNAPIDLRNEANEIFNLGVNRIRLDFTNEDADFLFNILFETIEKLDGKSIIPVENSIYGHYLIPVD